jgi:tetratricopeptide (TPR) repeat protein
VLYATTFYVERDFPRAIAELQQQLQVHPDFPEGNRYLARSYAQLGDYPHALSAIQRAAAASGLAEHGDLGWILARMGRTREADSVLAVTRTQAAHGYVPSGTFALIHLGLRNTDSAFFWLRRAATEVDPPIVYFKIDPRYQELHSDPRFHELLALMNFE